MTNRNHPLNPYPGYPLPPDWQEQTGPAQGVELHPYPPPPYPYAEGPERSNPVYERPPGESNPWEQIPNMRWGDADVASSVATMGPFSFPSKQLVHTATPRPIAWLLQFNADGVEIPAGETSPINVQFEVTIGCGQSETTFIQNVPLTLANGYRIPLTAVPPQLFLPASHIQVRTLISYRATALGTVRIAVACMAAPWAAIPAQKR